MGRESRIKQFPSAAERDRQKLLGYARNFDTEAQWQAFLDAKAPTPEIREELERVVGPLLRHRRGCANKTCQSAEFASWRPVLIFRLSDDLAESPINAVLTQKFCRPCRDLIELDDLLTDEVWSKVVQTALYAGSPTPDKSLTRVTWEALT